ncbi:MAG: patatin-like phospholipase family protein [Methylocystis sp.]|uniref:patatin-like phospholipase family protein n=1 Tax=Methylocystis sp. TaxID=1911079 RepID=UPI003939ADE5
MSEDTTKKFPQVFAEEIEDINQRRRNSGRPEIPTAEVTPKTTHDIVGLALSGGGVRCAAFCLGALQGLDSAGLINRLDYLSTVSGGGYIGSAMTLAMSKNGGRFPFDPPTSYDGETQHTKHIRDNSRYLVPKGLKSFPVFAAIYIRGLLSGALIALPVLLSLAALTIFFSPTHSDLDSGGFLEGGLSRVLVLGDNPFPITTAVALVVAALLFIYALAAHGPPRDIRGPLAAAFGTMVTLILVALIVEIQPKFILAQLETGGASGAVAGGFLSLSKYYTIVGTVIAAATPISLPFMNLLAKSAVVKKQNSLTQKAAKLASRLIIYIVALIVPLILWILYIELSYWGISVSADRWNYPHAPEFLQSLFGVAQWAIGNSIEPGSWSAHFTPSVIVYLAIALPIFLVFWYFIDVNANSLHQYYRDRLVDAFLVDPTIERDEKEESKNIVSDDFLLTEISTVNTPYHLINTTLNVPGSARANRRGRNGDFFLLSRNFVGSEVTGYVETNTVKHLWGGDIGTAMAISGAAAAPNMGIASLRPLAFTFALLNVRLGRWFPNPKKLSEFGKRANWPRPQYFLREAFFRTKENFKFVFLSDGGHIDNLGVYELLRRRAAVIVAVDGEADAEMDFPSLIQLQRLARIDLGVRIRLPWGEIKTHSRETSAAIANEQVRTKSFGPHAAIGIIEYPEAATKGETGVLIYLKASLTGDENDYVNDYKKRNPDFPHETTLNQFFSEEQFEVYRALGYHISNRLFNGQDCASVEPDLIGKDKQSFKRAEQLLNVTFRPCPQSAAKTPDEAMA